jgi:NADH dehydrogenase FAD-containing subunit
MPDRAARPPAAPPARVAVVGAGVAGLRAFSELRAAGLDAFCVDPKPFPEFLPASIECLVRGRAAADRWLLRWDPAVAARLERGRCVRVTAAAVHLHDGRALPFDFAVVCVGAAWPAVRAEPGALVEDKAARAAALAASHAALRAAPAVVVVGGGPVGVELAAEVAEAFPGKHVTLIAAGKELLPRMAPAARARAAAWLAARRVEVFLGERVVEWGGAAAAPALGTVLTNAYTQRAGLIFRCTGGAPAVAELAAAAESVLRLAPDGRVEVEPTLQARGAPNVFVAGDAASTSEEKTSVMADYAALVAAQNVIALAAGRPPAELQTFPAGFFGLAPGAAPPLAIGAALGARDGVMQLGDRLIAGRVAAWVCALVGVMVRRRAAGSWLWSRALVAFKANLARDLRAAAARAAPAGRGAGPLK